MLAPHVLAALALVSLGCGASIGDGVDGDPDAGRRAESDDSSNDVDEPDAAPPEVTAEPCTEGDAQLEYAGHCYSLFTATPIKWVNAEAACVTLGGHLASITTGLELGAIGTLDATIGNNRVWLGLNDRASGGDFVWVSGEPFTFDNFDSGEPSDSDPDDDCVNMLGGGDAWNDDDCGHSHAYLCERVMP